MVDLVDVLTWAFEQNYYLDKSNAAVHCSPVKFSPITFRLCEALMSVWPNLEDYSSMMGEVKSHMGQYEEDKGR